MGAPDEPTAVAAAASAVPSLVVHPFQQIYHQQQHHHSQHSHAPRASTPIDRFGAMTSGEIARFIEENVAGAFLFDSTAAMHWSKADDPYAALIAQVSAENDAKRRASIATTYPFDLVRIDRVYWVLKAAEMIADHRSKIESGKEHMLMQLFRQHNEATAAVHDCHKDLCSPQSLSLILPKAAAAAAVASGAMVPLQQLSGGASGNRQMVQQLIHTMGLDQVAESVHVCMLGRVHVCDDGTCRMAAYDGQVMQHVCRISGKNYESYMSFASNSTFDYSGVRKDADGVVRGHVGEGRTSVAPFSRGKRRPGPAAAAAAEGLGGGGGDSGDGGADDSDAFHAGRDIESGDGIDALLADADAASAEDLATAAGCDADAIRALLAQVGGKPPKPVKLNDCTLAELREYVRYHVGMLMLWAKNAWKVKKEAISVVIGQTQQPVAPSPAPSSRSAHDDAASSVSATDGKRRKKRKREDGTDPAAANGGNDDAASVASSAREQRHAAAGSAGAKRRKTAGGASALTASAIDPHFASVPSFGNRRILMRREAADAGADAVANTTAHMLRTLATSGGSVTAQRLSRNFQKKLTKFQKLYHAVCKIHHASAMVGFFETSSSVVDAAPMDWKQLMRSVAEPTAEECDAEVDVMDAFGFASSSAHASGGGPSSSGDYMLYLAFLTQQPFRSLIRWEGDVSVAYCCGGKAGARIEAGPRAAYGWHVPRDPMLVDRFIVDRFGTPVTTAGGERLYSVGDDVARKYRQFFVEAFKIVRTLCPGYYRLVTELDRIVEHCKEKYRTLRQKLRELKQDGVMPNLHHLLEYARFLPMNYHVVLHAHMSDEEVARCVDIMYHFWVLCEQSPYARHGALAGAAAPNGDAPCEQYATTASTHQRISGMMAALVPRQQQQQVPQQQQQQQDDAADAVPAASIAARHINMRNHCIAVLYAMEQGLKIGCHTIIPPHPKFSQRGYLVNLNNINDYGYDTEYRRTNYNSGTSTLMNCIRSLLMTRPVHELVYHHASWRRDRENVF
jgi:hypothetical protein